MPGFGIVSHILPAFTRKPLLGGMRVMIGCMIAIGFLSYMVWGHHMFVSGMNPFSAILFSVPTLIITIPATVATLMWLGSIYGANLRFTSASLFCLGFISVFISGGISGFFLAQPAIDTYLHATYFVVAHFHFVMAVAAIFGIFAGTYFWMPKMIGRMMNETLGKLHFWLTFIGVYCIFMPMHYLGLAGNVRRYASFTDDYLIPLIPVHKFITIAALLTGAAQLIFLYNLIHTRWWGPLAPDNPWEATSLEWSTTSPPPFDNFGGRHLVVHQGPYEYSVEGAAKDYVMQTDPDFVTRSLTSTEKRKMSVTTFATRTALRGPAGDACDRSLQKVVPAQTGVWVAVSAIAMSFAALTSALVVRARLRRRLAAICTAADFVSRYGDSDRQ